MRITVGLVLGMAACGGSSTPAAHWTSVLSAQPAALLSVWANDPTDVFVVGGDPHDGSGPTALHYDGTSWSHIATTIDGVDLWWTFGFADGTVYASGTNGTILRYDGTSFAPMTTPATAGVVFGMWGAASNDVWAVGGNADGGGNGFVWHYDGSAWTARTDVPAQIATVDTVFKVNGRATDDVWMVGSAGLVLHWNGSALDASQIDTDGTLLSVARMSDRFVTVGTNFDGILYENVDGSDSWASALPSGGPALNGVAASGTDAFAVGHGGVVLRRDASAWTVESTAGATTENLHAAFVDSDGNVWAVGGQFDGSPTTDGALIVRGAKVASTIQP